MMKRIIAGCLAVAVIGYAVVGMVHAQTSSLSYPGSDLTCTNAVSGDGWISLAAKVGAPSAIALANQEGGNLNTNIRVGQRVCWALSPVVTTPPTTAPPVTTEPPPTTAPPTTQLPTTEPPATTAPPPTTPPTTQPPAGVLFAETFDGGAGLDRFNSGVFHRDNNLVQTRQWSADHDMNCGDPSTQRTIHRDTDEWLFACRDHVMTSIGDTSGYSIGWFSPKQTFTNARSVSWDVNVTDLKARQWWEVAITPAAWRSGVASCPQCASETWVPSGVPYYPDGSIVVGNGPFGGDLHIRAADGDFNPAGVGFCGKPWALDLEGCASKAIRRTFTLTDNGNGTVTLSFLANSWTFAGSFPDEFTVVLKDHNYTPTKDGQPVGMTWHWDNIVVG